MSNKTEDKAKLSLKFLGEKIDTLFCDLERQIARTDLKIFKIQNSIGYHTNEIDCLALKIKAADSQDRFVNKKELCKLQNRILSVQLAAASRMTDEDERFYQLEEKIEKLEKEKQAEECPYEQHKNMIFKLQEREESDKQEAREQLKTFGMGIFYTAISMSLGFAMALAVLHV